MITADITEYALVEVEISDELLVERDIGEENG